MSGAKAGLGARLQAQIHDLRDAAAYKNYVRARSEVLRMLDRAAESDGRPSDYWLEELEGFDYMFDASPLLIERLRQQSYHLTGLRTYDYRSHRTVMRGRMAAKLDELVRIAGGSDLLVPESPILGGFGFEIEGQLYNIDTLKFFEVMIGLKRAGIVGAFRQSSRRQVVWEIGAGWGGFAYQLKTLFSDVTYVISDLPEVILFSATYLPTLFPDARLAFVQRDSDPTPWDVDFVFVPHTLTDRVRPPQLDLALNMVSFQEMTTDQVDEYARHAFDLGAPHFYSLNRDRSPYNEQLSSVREVLGRYYWLHELEILPVPYTKMLDHPKRPRRGLRARGGEHSYRHIHGLRRLIP